MLKYLPLVVAISCVPISQSTSPTGSGKSLNLSDRTYEDQIRTLRLYSESSDPLAETTPAVTAMGNWNLLLEFDDLQDQRDSYYAKIIHCNANWTKSTLSDLDFLADYNEFPLNNFEFSVDTQIPYVHYWFKLPPVKLPGNYVIVVYRGSDQGDIILSKRFMVFDQKISFVRDKNLIGSVGVAFRNQQINFTINYKNFELLNPMETVTVTIRQNQRWDNMAQGIKPSFLRDNLQELEYRVFDDSNMFTGGNEFRFFDLRSINNPGQNVNRVNRSSKPFAAYIDLDNSRASKVYSQYLDLNGQYVIQNYDYRDNSFSNYVDVKFSLASTGKIPGNVYLVGAFNQWALNESSRMTYDSARNVYQKSELLKQGYYNYQYVVRSDKLPSNYFEGSHFETENQYEVFVYYRTFRPLADMLIGYYVVNENPR